MKEPSSSHSSSVPHLNIEQPWSEVVDPLLPLLHAPCQYVQCVPGEEALVSGIVDLLPSEVPCAEDDVHLVLGGRRGGRKEEEMRKEE